MNKTEQKFKDNLSVILDMIEKKESKNKICKFLCVKQETLNKYLKKYKINYKGNQGLEGKNHNKQQTSYKEYTENGKSIGTSTLRVKLIKQGIKEEKCECCGLIKWMDKPIPLELHHIDGNRFNNSLDNLKILCSNCHMQSHNYCNVKKENNYKINYYKKPKKEHICEHCNNTFFSVNKQKFCSVKCYQENSKNNIPNIYELLDMFKKLKSFTKVGKYYSVSDNAVRKWCKSYNILDLVKNKGRVVELKDTRVLEALD